ncbi:MAG: ABC transporter permease [Pseudomonadaceae bacterium]|nr:ABC transporter permease [Pseudomonadaceae bacterium]
MAVHLIAVSVDRSLAKLTAPWLGDDVLVLRKPAAKLDDYVALRTAWRNGDLAETLTEMTPVLEGEIENANSALHILGIDAFSWRVGGLFDSTLNADDQSVAATLATGAVLASEELPGDALLLQTALGEVRTQAWPLGALPENWLVADIGQVSRWLGTSEGSADLSYVLATQRQRQENWMGLAERMLPGVTAAAGQGEPELAGLPEGWTVARAGSDNTLRVFAGSIMFNLAALGSLSAVVAGFLLYQAAVVSFQREALLRQRLLALGVQRGTLRALFLLQTLIDGIAAGALGLLLGIALARVALSLTSPDAAIELTIDWVVWAKALGTAFLVSGAARMLASRRDSSVRKMPWITAALALAMLPGLFFDSWGLLGAFAGLLACCLLAVLTVGPGFVFADRFSVSRLPTIIQLGVNQLLAGRREMGAALTALALAIATAISIAVMVDSFRTDLLRVLDQRLIDPVYIALASPAEAEDEAGAVLRPSSVGRAASAELRERIQALDPDAVITATGEAQARVEGRRIDIMYGPFDSAHTRRYGYDRDLADGSVLANEQLLRAFDLVVDDALEVTRGDRLQALKIEGSFPGFGDVHPTLLVNVADAQRLEIEPRWSRFAVASERADALLAALVGDSRWRVRDAIGVRRSAEEQFDQTFAITRALTVLALLVAGFGTLAAMLALRLAQARQLALLRALGVSRRELWLMEVVRGLTLGGFACALALPLGLLMAWILCAVINPRSFGWMVSFQPTPAMVLPALAIGLGAALAATLISNWRAGHNPGADTSALVTGSGARGSESFGGDS